MSDTENNHGIILFDGVCNLCAGVVQFIIRYDPHGYFRFASLQSKVAKKLLEKTGTHVTALTTMVLIERNRAYLKSDAVLHIAQRLQFPWSVVSIVLFIPRSIRDFFYMIVSRNRYQWFGKQHTCLVPTPDIEERFLDISQSNDI